MAKLDGPLQDDAVLALGKIGDKRALATLAALQRTGGRSCSRGRRGICLLGVNCSSHIGYLAEDLRRSPTTIPAFRSWCAAAAGGLGAIAIKGNAEALGMLFDARHSVAGSDPRAAGARRRRRWRCATRRCMLEVLQAQKDQAGAIALLAEGFDMLEEDLEEEQFFVAVRRGYWAAAEARRSGGSPSS